VALRVADSTGKTDVGRQRDANEDSYVDRAPVFAVADGMGGAQAGEVASSTAAKVFEDGARGDGTPEQRLTALVREANRRIFELAISDESKRGMGTTLTAALLEGDEVALAHVGDSRAYRMRDGHLEQLTHDHSLVAELERSGQISPEDAEHHPQRSIITRALGPEPDVEVDAHSHSARAGDLYVICSDGLTGMISDDEMAAILRGTSSLEAAADSLVKAANQSGGKDNITVVLFSVEDGEEPSRPAAVSDETIAQGLTADDLQAAVAEQERAGESLHRDPTELRPRPRASRGGPSRGRRLVAALGGLVVLAVVLVGGVLGARQIYFVGTNDAGFVTTYRGLPYELPLGLELYSQQYASSVPARTIPGSRRERVLDHEWRSRDDAEDLVRQLERGTLDLGSASR
jgi:protein phosphatase